MAEVQVQTRKRMIEVPVFVPEGVKHEDLELMVDRLIEAGMATGTVPAIMLASPDGKGMIVVPPRFGKSVERGHAKRGA
jgi:hypothetical protein